jgi:hypothetical protein
VDHGIRNGVFRNLPAASGAAWKGRQMAAMPEGVSSLTAGISKEIPAFWARHYYI